MPAEVLPMVVLLSLWGCSEPVSTAPDEVLVPAGEITADGVLQRHLDVSNQCAILVADTYTFEWDTVVTDKKTTAKAEKVMQQGRQGTSFTRLHQQTRPTIRFTGFGLATDGKWWSAGDQGVKADLPVEVAKTLMVHLDPTPVCSFQARWSERTYVGEEDHKGARAHHVRGTWADGTSTDMWFDTTSGLLVGSKTEIEGLSNELVMKDYVEYDGVKWPEQVISSRVEAGLHIFVAEKLRRLTLDKPDFRDVGPAQIAALLATDAKERSEE